jgi:hypothetical protein
MIKILLVLQDQQQLVDLSFQKINLILLSTNINKANFRMETIYQATHGTNKIFKIIAV